MLVGFSVVFSVISFWGYHQNHQTLDVKQENHRSRHQWDKPDDSHRPQLTSLKVKMVATLFFFVGSDRLFSWVDSMRDVSVFYQQARWFWGEFHWGFRIRKLPGLLVIKPWHRQECFTLWLLNIAMENGPFIDGLPIKSGDFPWLC